MVFLCTSCKNVGIKAFSSFLPELWAFICRKDASHGARTIWSQLTSSHSTSADSRLGYNITSAASEALSLCPNKCKAKEQAFTCLHCWSMTSLCRAAVPGLQSPDSPPSPCWSVEEHAGGCVCMHVCLHSFPAPASLLIYKLILPQADL